MSLSRDAYHHGNLQKALVASAVQLIEQSGQEAFSLREAARAVGVSANAAYRHFEDKSALLTAVAAHGFGQLSQHMQEALRRASGGPVQARPAVARFKAIGRAYVEFALEHPEWFRLMFGERGVGCLSADSPGKAARSMPTPWELLGESLDALVAEGVLPPERRKGAELKAWTVVHGFASLVLGGQVTGSEELDEALEFAVIGLCGTGIQ
jgi:AcrR family transcriptional regulator